LRILDLIRIGQEQAAVQVINVAEKVDTVISATDTMQGTLHLLLDNLDEKFRRLTGELHEQQGKSIQTEPRQ
jgi:succinylarginine dihydrolase